MLSESLKNIWTEFRKGTLKIYVINVKEVSCRDMRAAYLLMSDSRQKKCDSLKNEEDKKRCIVADSLLRVALEDITGKPTEYFLFDLMKNGKPYCVNADCNFNISHSGDYVAVAVDTSRQVGIDIERIRPIKSGVMRMFCSETEAEFIKGKDDNDNGFLTSPVVLERFYKVWTFKEATAKLSGEGISDNFKTILYDEKKCFCEIFDGYCLSAVAD